MESYFEPSQGSELFSTTPVVKKFKPQYNLAMPESIFVPRRLPRWGIAIVYRVVQFLFFIFSRVHISGRENLPADRNFIFSPNHLSSLDVGLGLVTLGDELGSKTVLFAGDTWRKKWLTRFILQLTNVIWVHRGETSPSTIKIAIQVLRAGYILSVAPAGTRSRHSHALLKGRAGAAFLALKTGTPILPVAITNMQNLWQAMKRLARIDIQVVIGKPFVLERCADESRIDHACLEERTDEIMCRIAALLPPEYRGEYAEHPRLKELLGTETLTRIE